MKFKLLNKSHVVASIRLLALAFFIVTGSACITTVDPKNQGQDNSPYCEVDIASKNMATLGLSNEYEKVFLENPETGFLKTTYRKRNLSENSASISINQRTTVLQEAEDIKTLVVSSYPETHETCGKTPIMETMFNNPNGKSVSDYYKEVSKDRISISGDYLSVSSISGINETSSNEELKNAAIQMGVNPSEYKRIAYLKYCDANVAGSAPLGGDWFCVYQCESRKTFIHEMGHTLGLGHAKTRESGEFIEYGDGSSVMGSSEKFLNSANLHALGWLDEIEFQDNTDSGIYSISSLHDFDESFIPKVYRVKTSGGDFLISLRNKENDFETDLSSTYDRKLNIHHALPEGQSLFLGSIDENEHYQDEIQSIKISNVKNYGSTFQFKVEILKKQTRSGSGDCSINAFNK